MGRGLYIEVHIRADLDRVWKFTQDPALHQRWDARFTTIDYLPGTDPQRFRYATRLAPGLTVAGEGVTAGEHTRPDGTRTSALRFHSPLMTGSGYWRYVPTPTGVRFLTGYDYTPRWPLLDLLMRPLMGWATAWSFDRLRIWLEDGVPPRRSPLRLLPRWGAPSARRCLRIPPDRTAGRAPALLEAL